jgi:purine nucleosidase
MRVHLDTDIGNDIDDAVCLAWMLAEPRIELTGITTVSGPVEKRSAIAQAIVNTSGQSVPLWSGLSGPILGGPGQPQCAAFDRLSPADQALQTPEGAVEALRQAAADDLTILAIGPLTNIAAFCLAHPEEAARIPELRIMGGVFFPGGQSGLDHSGGPGSREWNMLCDPAAAAIVFGFPWRKLTCVGLDVTRQVRMEADEVRQRFRAGGPVLSLVAELAEAWFSHRPEIVFHDPLAAVSLVEPDVLTWRPGRVGVEWRSEGLAGLTGFQPDPDSRISAADSVDADAFFEAYFRVFGV